MVAYRYTGIDRDGLRTEGQISAECIEEAEKRIQQQGLSILSLAPESNFSSRKKKGSVLSAGNSTSNFPKRISAQDAATVLENMGVMAETGVPFVESIDASIASARTPPIEQSLMLVKDAVVAGQGLSTALRAAPNMFPAIICDMIRVAEHGGRLDKALFSGAQYLQRAADLNRKIKNAMMYPMVMLSISFITILVLVIFVMPRFATVFNSMKVDLPFTTRFLLHAGDFARTNPIVTGIGFGASLLLVYFGWQQPPVRRVAGLIAGKLPILGELIRRLAMARALQSIATLSGSNVPLLQALETGAKVAGDPTVTAALETVRNDIEQGRSMSEAMAQHKVFPKQVVQMILMGERTGRLPELLERICASMEIEVDAKLKSMVAILEPLLILFMGLIVGTITVSIIGPIYSVIENVK